MVNNQFPKHLIGQHSKHPQSLQLAELLLNVVRVRIFLKVWYQILIYFNIQRIAKKFNLSDTNIVLQTT